MSKLSILLLEGESGVGKEVLARTIHLLSGRSGPFVAVNCGALTSTLVESQFFGHVKGACSGATRDEPGLVRASSGGTLFLDEIGELSPSAQAVLLRVLQEQEVLPVGGTRPVPVDLRIVAATLRPIDTSETFRVDLYARIAAYVHRIAPLRERRGDLGILVAGLLKRVAPDRAERLRLSPELVTGLVGHVWPRNVRELEQVLSVAAVLQPGELLRLEDVGEALRVKNEPSCDRRRRRAPERGRTPGCGGARARARRREGNVSEVSRAMGKTRMQIHRWMKRSGRSGVLPDRGPLPAVDRGSPARRCGGRSPGPWWSGTENVHGDERCAGGEDATSTDS